jgi:hypothetical protein
MYPIPLGVMSSEVNLVYFKPDQIVAPGVNLETCLKTARCMICYSLTITNVCPILREMGFDLLER